MIPNLSAKSAKRRHFRPHPALTAAAAVVILLTARLAIWQFDRAEQKAALEQAAHTAINAPPIILNDAMQDDSQTALYPYRRVVASGVFVDGAQIAIDNRVQNRIAGYHLVAPLSLTGGGAIAVNRGFIARHQNIPPPPSGEVTLHGILQKDAADAFVLSPNTEDGMIWQNLNLTKYAAAVNLPLFSLVLQQTPTSDSAAKNNLQPASVRVDYKSARSIGYAWQWISFCALAILFYILLGFRETPPANKRDAP